MLRIATSHIVTSHRPGHAAPPSNAVPGGERADYAARQPRVQVQDEAARPRPISRRPSRPAGDDHAVAQLARPARHHRRGRPRSDTADERGAVQGLLPFPVQARGRLLIFFFGILVVMFALMFNCFKSF